MPHAETEIRATHDRFLATRAALRALRPATVRFNECQRYTQSQIAAGGVGIGGMW